MRELRETERGADHQEQKRGTKRMKREKERERERETIYQSMRVYVHEDENNHAERE